MEWEWWVYLTDGWNRDILHEWWGLHERLQAVDRCGNPANCDYCDWCGWWGWLKTDTASVLPKHRLVKYRSCEYGSLHLGFVLCLRCVDLYENDKEPPWWPNNRDRYHEMLLRNLQPPAFADVDSTSILRLIAEYVAENRP